MRAPLALALLVALLGSGCSARAGEGDERVTITIEHSRFEPGHMSFEPGQTVEFVVVNGDPIDHELIIGPPDVQTAHELGTEPHHGARDGEVSVAVGAEASTTYTATRPVEFACHLPGHYPYGMRGKLVPVRTA